MNPGKIRRLSPVVAERIAAGEVIERPASVVKELVENSLDAGATELVVTLKDGGKGLIEVLDNGEGMAPEDLEICIERHATSKLTSLQDLENISTLGFRGEALPSIAAVSELTLLSRHKSSDTTYILNVGDLLGRLGELPPAEKITFGQFINSRHGTRIQVQGLFSQVPARLKFLKSQAAEVSQVKEWLERLALAYPQTGFKLISDGRVLLSLRPESETERIRNLLTDGEDFPILSIDNEQAGVKDSVLKMKLHWIQGLSTAQSRKLVQIVNSRAVRDRLLQQAILAPFKQSLLPGQFPAVVLNMEIDPGLIDVNVHPAKTEIRFLNSQKIFSTLDRMVKTLIAEKGAPAIAPSTTPSSKPLENYSHSPSYTTPRDSFWKSSSLNNSSKPVTSWKTTLEKWNASESEAIDSFKKAASQASVFSNSSHLKSPHTHKSETIENSPPESFTFNSELPNPFKRDPFPSLSETVSDPTLFRTTSSTSESTIESEHPRATPFQSQSTNPTIAPQRFDFSSLPLQQALPKSKPIGVLFNTYIIYEGSGEMILIDQHAAHERIRYEKLKRRALGTSGNESPLSSQALLMPETIKFSEEYRRKIEAKLSFLNRFGFDVEIFGEDTLLFRSVPSEWGMAHLKTRLKNLVNRIESSAETDHETEQNSDSPLQSSQNRDLHEDQSAIKQNILIDEQIFEALASEACHSAVRAGDRLDLIELHTLVEQLFQCEHPWNCPHGRPTVAKIPEGKIEEWFQRRV